MVSVTNEIVLYIRLKKQGERKKKHFIVNNLHLDGLRRYLKFSPEETVRTCVNHSSRDQSNETLTLSYVTYASETYDLVLRIEFFFTTLFQIPGVLLRFSVRTESLLLLRLSNILPPSLILIVSATSEPQHCRATSQCFTKPATSSRPEGSLP
jgi:hypothetical protein